MNNLHLPTRCRYAFGSKGRATQKGFALIVTLTLMVLLALVVIAMLSLSTVVLRTSSADQNRATAQANARLALILAIGNLQEAMGPDTRVSASAAILDANAATPKVDGVDHPHLLGVWESWGGWLNAKAENPEGASLAIGTTYDPGRTIMFRKWLVSSSPTETADLAFAKTGKLDDTNSVLMVGESSVADASDYVRARLIPLKENKQTGRLAWWVSGENQKADITRNSPRPALAPAQAELAHGNGSSRDMSDITGLSAVTRDEITASKLITTREIEVAGADPAAVANGFHDFTADSLGLMTDTRWGGLKKDLSLLFEQPTLPTQFTRSATTAFSPRPQSADLIAYGPKIPERGFTSFEQMQAFARQYKNPTTWAGSVPTSQTAAYGDTLNKAEPEGFYRRMPVISKFYSIFNLQSVKDGKNAQNEDKYDCYLTYSPVVQLWNPYNVPLEIDERFQIHTLPYKIMPIRFKTYKKDLPFIQPPFQGRSGWVGVDQAGYNASTLGGDYKSPFQTEAGSEKVKIAPGMFMIFSFKTRLGGQLGIGSSQEPFKPGFDPGAVGSARLKVLDDVTTIDKPALALQIQPYWDRANAQWFGGNPGALSIVGDYGGTGTSGTHISTGLTIDWFAEPRSGDPMTVPELKRQDYVSISPDRSHSIRAQWNLADTEPIPIGVMGAVLKTSEDLLYDTIDWKKDWRNKTWSQAAPGLNAAQMLASYTDNNLLELQRMNGAYQMHFRTISGSAELASLIGHSGENGFIGGTLEAPISAAAAYEIPTAPVQSLAGFSGLRLQPGWYDWSARVPVGNRNVNNDWPHKVAAYSSGVPGVGVGNSFAVPMIPGDKVYQYHDISKNNPNSQIDILGPPAAQESNAFSDFWDHQLLVNDGLWDSYYSSSLTSGQRPSDNGAETLPQLLDKVFKASGSPPNANFEPMGGVPAATVISDLQAADGYLRSAMYLANRGVFNVNSVSIEAWYSLFTGLREHNAVYRDKNGQLKEIPIPEGEGLVTRYNTETAAVETENPRVGALVDGVTNWTGVRFLTDDQVRKLAEECVVQVKKRGPFLNMSDFVNRRLSTGELGVRGALQAAIDFDDDGPDSKSINQRFKENGDMVSSNTSLYPFPKAAEGSMFTGIPGYVVQSDILKPLGNSLTVRDDTFRIRAYGEATDANGKVLATAHCEAIVQRTVDYVDTANDPTIPVVPLDQNGNVTGATALTTVNHKFGRRFEIVSFRWLSPNEI